MVGDINHELAEHPGYIQVIGGQDGQDSGLLYCTTDCSVMTKQPQASSGARCWF